jgi:hypothetical protein
VTIPTANRQPNHPQAIMTDAELNPYRSPATDSDENSRYLGLNNTRLTYRECRRVSPNVFVYLVLAVFKTLGVRLATSVAFIPELVPLSLSQLSAATQAKSQAFTAAANALGYELQFILGMPIIGRAEAVTTFYHLPGGNHLLCVDYVREETGRVDKERAAFSTMLVDGTHLMTSSAAAELDHPATTQVVFLTGADLATLSQRHDERVRKQTQAVEPLVTVDDCEALARWLDRIHIDFLRERGVLEPISTADFNRLTQAMAEPLPPRLPTWLTWLDFLTWTLGLLVAWFSLFGEPIIPGMFFTRFMISLGALAAIVIVTTIKQLVRARMK